MPANKNAVVRYKVLDEMLSDRYAYYDIHDLTNRCNNRLASIGEEQVSQRTIEKDIQFIQGEPFNAEIHRSKANGKSCIRYENSDYSIFIKKLNKEEEQLLSEVLSTLGQFEGLTSLEWLDGLKKRLGVEEKERTIIEFSSNPYLKNSNMLGSLYLAIANKQVIKVNYRTFKAGKDGMTSIVMHPYLLKQYSDRWYLIGKTEEKGYIITYAIDRIETFEQEPTVAYREPEQDWEERYEDVVGVTVFDDKTPEKIYIWVDDIMYNYIWTKPIHGSQTAVIGKKLAQLRADHPELEGGNYISLDLIVNYELIHNEILRAGNAMVVVEPEQVRNEVKENIEKALKRYK